MTRLTDEQTRKFELEEAGEQSYFKALDDVAKVIDELYADCKCPDEEVLKDCKDEWIETWSHGINRELKQEIAKLKEKGK